MVKIYRAFSEPGPYAWVRVAPSGPYEWFSNDGKSGSAIPRARSLKKAIDTKVGRPTQLVEMKTRAPGEFHPRIWRPECQLRAPEYFKSEFTAATLAAQNLFVDMRDLFQYIEPRKANWNAFGHEIRKALIVACTEVEALCKGVLRANSYPKTRNLNMRDDYFKLARPLRLWDWTLTLMRYPELGTFTPFRAWRSAAFKSLPWYSAYNATKHDRDTEFKHASLRNLVDAMAAIHVLLVAQFGQFGFRISWTQRQESDFGFTKLATFPLDDHYIPPELQAGASWQAVPYQF